MKNEKKLVLVQVADFDLDKVAEVIQNAIGEQIAEWNEKTGVQLKKEDVVILATERMAIEFFNANSKFSDAFTDEEVDEASWYITTIPPENYFATIRNIGEQCYDIFIAE